MTEVSQNKENQSQKNENQELPEQTKKISDKEFDETIDYLKNHPLFMKEMPKDIQSNEMLLAMQNLLYDDTPENLAKHFNEKGNELFKKGPGKRYYQIEALKSYTEGIDSKGSEKDINSKLHCNRALLQMKFKNFGKAVDDCLKSIEYNSQFLKAYIRCGQAYFQIGKFQEAVSILNKGLAIQQDQDLLQLREQAQKQLDKLNQHNQQKVSLQKTEEEKLYDICKQKNVMLGPRNLDFPQSSKDSIQLDDQNNIHLPIFIIYPEFTQTDYISESQESNVLMDHLQEVFGNGLPYDSEKIYSTGNIEVYLELNCVKYIWNPKNQKGWPKGQGFKKIDPSKKILDIITTPGYVLPLILELYIVCPQSKFYQQFKAQYDIVE